MPLKNRTKVIHKTSLFLIRAKFLQFERSWDIKMMNFFIGSQNKSMKNWYKLALNSQFEWKNFSCSLNFLAVWILSEKSFFLKRNFCHERFSFEWRNFWLILSDFFLILSKYLNKRNIFKSLLFKNNKKKKKKVKKILTRSFFEIKFFKVKKCLR